MKTILLLCRSAKFYLLPLLLLGKLTASAQTYTTIANGSWSSASTWQGGSIPNANNITATMVINIKHVITYTGSSINNSGTIKITSNGGLCPRLIVAGGINITNNLTGKIYVTDAELRQYRFAGGGESGTSQSGNFKNSGGYVAIKNSFVEIARTWTNELAGVVVFRNSSLELGDAYNLNATAIDTLEYTSVSVGMRGNGDFISDGLSAYYKSLRVEVASSGGNFELKSGIINGNIDYVTLKNHLTGAYCSGQLKVNSAIITTGLTLDSYCIGNPANYQPNGKIIGAQAADCSVNYFPAGLFGASQAALNFTMNPVLVSGTDLLVGALYKYEGVAPGIDAYVKIDSLVGGAAVAIIDDNAPGSGFMEGFQPQVKPGLAAGQSYAVFSFNYKITGTPTPHSMNTFSLTALDIDGTTTLKEFDQIGMGTGATAAYNNASPAISLTQVAPGTYRGINTDGISVNGIDTSAKKYMFTVTNSNVSSFTVKVGVVKTNTNQTARQFSLYMKGFAYPNLLSLPVKLVSFTAALNNNNVDLRWTTASEENLSHFVVERSTDGVNYSQAAVVFAYGNTTETKNYNFPDPVANVQSSIIYYRLRSIDADGKSQLSQVRIVRIGKQNAQINLITYPNPASSELRITVPSVWQNKEVLLEVFTTTGQRLKAIRSANVSQTETISVSELSKGIYIIKANCGSETAQQKFIKN